MSYEDKDPYGFTHSQDGWYDGDEIIPKEKLIERQDKIMNRVQRYKSLVLDVLFKRVIRSPDNESVYAFTALADSTEDSVVKRQKLDIEREKNDIARQGNDNLSSLFSELQESRLQRNANKAPASEVRKGKSKKYIPTGDENINDDETIAGMDVQTYKDYKNRRYEEKLKDGTLTEEE